MLFAVMHLNGADWPLCVRVELQEELALMKQFGSKGREVVLSKVPYWML
jgi:hypothetical protein